jgi:hypothetical protein
MDRGIAFLQSEFLTYDTTKPAWPLHTLGANAPGFQQIRDALVGNDLFAMEQHLKRGLLSGWD